ncbi:uncharacterized protein LOC143855866 [Tasmannia lanceolata]|uniref:uncharacterized protein LOC143855866 n=1 Tax=Tasmannia lanceolata TaxID=3420 RepID=UPI004064484A
MRRFSEFINSCKLIDLPLEGFRFTWTNNQESLIKSRIDRFLLSREWEESSRNILQRALPRPISDHNPLILELSDSPDGSYPFKLDMALCENPDFNGKVADWWNAGVFNGWEGFVFCNKLRSLKVKIKEWAIQQHHAKGFRKEEILAGLERLESLESNGSLGNADRQLRAELLVEFEEIIRREEISWTLKSRATWLKAGDKNSKFFHRMANARRRINSINCLMVNGILLKEKSNISKAILDFYRNLYSSSCNWRPKLGGCHLIE